MKPYVKIQNGVPVNYSINQLQSDNLQTSFPEIISDELLADFNVYPVLLVTPPIIDHTKNIVQGTPVEQNGKWIQVWNISDASEEEIIQRTEEKAQLVREQRNELLAFSDWTQLTDSPVNKEDWALYRQQLRDVTNQEGFPFFINWPDVPVFN